LDFGFWIITQGASAELGWLAQSNQTKQVCQVTEPTETPLKVRADPNVPIITTLANGTQVYRLRPILIGF
jgi:hypothetical protein